MILSLGLILILGFIIGWLLSKIKNTRISWYDYCWVINWSLLFRIDR